MHLAINGYFINQPATGTGQYSREMLRALHDLRPGKITVLIPEGVEPKTARDLAPGADCRVLRIPIGGSLGKVWFEQVSVPRAAARLGADLLHVPYLGPPLFSAVPVAVTVHDLLQHTVPQLKGRMLVQLYNRLAAASAHRAAAIMADSEYTRSEVVSCLNVPPERAHRVYLAADARFSPSPERQETEMLQRKYGLSDTYLLYMGGLDWRKNVPALLRAYARSGCQAHLAIAGQVRPTSSGFPDLKAEAMRTGIAERVTFLGWADEADKASLYRNALAFVFPSRYEGFGLTPLEAMACGTPVLCSNATSLPEVVGNAALLFAPDDEAQLAAHIESVVNNPDLRDRLRSAGLEQAARFSWRTTAQLTLDIFRHILKEKRLVALA